MKITRLYKLIECKFARPLFTTFTFSECCAYIFGVEHQEHCCRLKCKTKKLISQDTISNSEIKIIINSVVCTASIDYAIQAGPDNIFPNQNRSLCQSNITNSLLFQGQAIVQLARTVPDVVVFGVCSKAKHEALKANNSPIDHLLERGSDYSSEIRKVQPDGVDIVLDCLCGEECNRGYSLLKPMGKYILYGSSNVVTGETKSFFSAARSVSRSRLNITMALLLHKCCGNSRENFFLWGKTRGSL